MKPLSQRQLDALRHLVSGKPQKQAAKDMGVSLDTFKVYAREIRYRLDAETTAEAMFKAGKAGIL